MSEMPRLSVVVPTCSRLPALVALLEQLRPLRQGVPAHLFEVIVSDDSRPVRAARLLRERFPDVRFIDGPGRGPAANRNHGARQARAEWLVFVDDDCQPADGWLRAIASEAAGTSADVDVIEGKIVAVNNEESLFKRHVENLNGDCFWSANLAIRHDLFEQLGGFDEDFLEAGGEDLEFAHRIRMAAARTKFSHDAVVYHPSHVMTWWGVLTHPFGIRWHVLYQLKSGLTVPREAPFWKVVPHVAVAETVTLLRRTLHAVRSLHTQPTGPTLSRTALSWLLFPVLLPFIVYWHAAFRRRLRV